MFTPNNKDLIPNLLWLFLGFRGRINREAFWLANALFIVILLLILYPYFRNLNDLLNENPEQFDQYLFLLRDQISDSWLITCTFLLSRFSQFMLFAKRAHDRGLPGFIAILSVIPMFDFLLLLFLGIVKGDPGPNKYGNFPNQKP